MRHVSQADGRELKAGRWCFEESRESDAAVSGVQRKWTASYVPLLLLASSTPGGRLQGTVITMDLGNIYLSISLSIYRSMVIMRCLGLPLTGSPRRGRGSGWLSLMMMMMMMMMMTRLTRTLSHYVHPVEEHPFFLFLFLQLSSDGSHTIRW